MDEVDFKDGLTTSVVTDNTIGVAAQIDVREGGLPSNLATNLGSVTEPAEDGNSLEQVDMITNSDPGSEETVIMDAADIKVEPEDLGTIQGESSPSKFGGLGGVVQKRGPGRPRKDGRLSPKPWKKQP